MADNSRHTWDLLLVVANDRYGAQQFGTVARIVDAGLRGGHSIQIWACGVANTLTENCCSTTAVSQSSLIGELVREYPGRFSWVACKSCSDDHGAAGHIPGVLTEPGFGNFRDFVDGAAKTVYIGGV